jgi:hypothetical protein
MRLKQSRAAAWEQITALLNEGYGVVTRMRGDYFPKRASRTYLLSEDNARYRQWMSEWAWKVQAALRDIFPTELEANQFFYAPNINTTGPHGVNDEFIGLLNRTQDLLAVLDQLRANRLDQYTDLPIKDRLHVEDIDGFSKVRDINHAMYDDLLTDGYLPVLENDIQVALEQILGETLHKEDHGGELNDLYTANLVVNGARTPTAFLLKGRGLKKKAMEIRDCGENGDQLVRLFDSPAELFVVQFVGKVSESIIRDVESKVALRRAQGKQGWFMIMDGQDTAKVLVAYGKMPKLTK